MLKVCWECDRGAQVLAGSGQCYGQPCGAPCHNPPAQRDLGILCLFLCEQGEIGPVLGVLCSLSLTDPCPSMPARLPGVCAYQEVRGAPVAHADGAHALQVNVFAKSLQALHAAPDGPTRGEECFQAAGEASSVMRTTPGRIQSWAGSGPAALQIEYLGRTHDGHGYLQCLRHKVAPKHPEQQRRSQ